MSKREFSKFGPWAFVCGLLLLALGAPARADDMNLSLSRLSQGDCSATLTGSDHFSLRSGNMQTLVPDNQAWASLMTQLAPVAMPAILAPVTTSGPRGFDMALQTSVTRIDSKASYWKAGTQGHGALATQTCDGRNHYVSPVFVSNRISVDKGLPMGFTLGTELGRVWGTNLWTVGGRVKWALMEGYRHWVLPDFAVRAAANTVVGDSQFSMTVLAADAVISKNIVAGRVMQVAPYLGGGMAMIFASSQLIDLTPNIDATACAAGTDPACQGLSKSQRGDDIGHNQTFKDLTMMRTRGFAGLQLRYRLFAFASEVTFDLLPPRKVDHDAGHATPRQWSVNFAPSLSF